MNELAFIVNPVARKGKARALVSELREFVSRRFPDASWLETQASGHATRLAQEAAHGGCRRLFSVGGDGTLNEVVNGLMALPEASRPAVGTLSSGTGGDFSRRLRELFPPPHDLDWIAAARPLRIDIGQARYAAGKAEETRFFLNIADAGLAGEVVRRVSRSRKIFGALEYLRATISAAWHYRTPRVRVSLTRRDGSLWEQEIDLLIALAANSRYFGGGMCIAPEAELSDGLFFIMVAERMSYPALVRQLPRIYGKKRMRHPRIRYDSGIRLEIKALIGDLPIDLDGEYFRTSRIAFDLLPQSLDILVPSQS